MAGSQVLLKLYVNERLDMDMQPQIMLGELPQQIASCCWSPASTTLILGH